MTELTLVAQSLIQRLNAPAQWHSVWIRAETSTDEETGITRATGRQELCVSIRPGKKVNVPDEHMGVPVVRVPWPKEG
jgi:hypothetical protein